MPLREGGIVIGFQLLSGAKSGLNASGFQGFEKSLRHRFVDLHAAHVEAVDAPSADNVLARTVVAGGHVPATIVGAQATAAVSAGGEALQQGGPFAQGAAALGVQRMSSVWLNRRGKFKLSA